MTFKEEIEYNFYTNPKNKRAISRLPQENQEYYLSILEKNKPIKKLIKAWKLEWKIYRDEVNEITKQQDLQTLEHYDKRITKRLLKEHGPSIYRSNIYYSLDHKVSVWYGWKNNIPPEEIGDISNLRYILCIDNCIKGTKCHYD